MKILKLLFILPIVISCVSELPLVKLNQTKTLEYPESYNAIYKSNGGRKNDFILNRKKALLERKYLDLLMRLDQMMLNEKINDENNDSEYVDKSEMAKLEAIKKFNYKVDLLKKQIIEAKKQSNNDEYLFNLRIELNNLICNEREGIIQLETKVQKLYGDVSFSTGSYKISKNGIKSINELISEIDNEVLRWKKYVNNCNEKIFENDIFVIVIDISGYADEIGSFETNKKLSENRAKTVELELKKQLLTLVKSKNLKLVFDKIYSSGYGEKLPPGVIKGPKNDPNRRVCLINFIVGPSRYID